MIYFKAKIQIKKENPGTLHNKNLAPIATGDKLVRDKNCQMYINIILV